MAHFYETDFGQVRVSEYEGWLLQAQDDGKLVPYGQPKADSVRRACETFAKSKLDGTR